MDSDPSQQRADAEPDGDHSSQGLINRPSGPVTQHFGSQRNVNTAGGDYAEGNIDKRQQTFIEIPAVSRQERRNRRKMLDNVQRIWIDGVLQHSLYHEVLIALGLREVPDAVVRPLDMQVRGADQSAEALPPDTHVGEVYDRFGETLLILGAPGAGKTTLLLELTSELLQRARDDEAHPIPVVFPLASWATNRRPLTKWLVDELSKRYDVPRKIAQRWVRAEQILPLLDGLDEVTQAQASACVEAINHFRQEHGLLPLVVCSRSTEYNELRVKLRLDGAIIVQPLTREQVRRYLREVGLNAAPSSQSPLWELLDTPLMLHIATLTYTGNGTLALAASATVSEQRDQLFAAYVARMFARKAVPTRYPPQQVTHWLAWLAWQLQRQSQPIFYLEQIQPAWLPDQRARWRYTLLDHVGGGSIVGLFSGLVVGLLTVLSIGPLDGAPDEVFFRRCLVLLYGLSGVLLSEHSAEMVYRLGWGLLLGLLYGLPSALLCELFGGQRDGLLVKPRSIMQAINHTLLGWLVGVGVFGMVYGVVGGLVGGLVAGFVYKQVLALFIGLLVGLFAGLLVGGFFGLFFGVSGALLGALVGKPRVRLRHIAAIENLRWYWPNAWRSALTGFLLGAGLFGLFIGLVSGLAEGLLSGLIYGVIFGVIFGLLGGRSIRQIPENLYPNQGIRRSAQRAILTGLNLGVAGGLLVGLLIGSISGVESGVGFGMTTGLLIGLPSTLAYGGYAYLSHWALRLVLWDQGAMPLRYIDFLDESADRILLRRVGGGYSFVHRLLLDWFAKQYSGPEAPTTPSVKQRQ